MAALAALLHQNLRRYSLYPILRQLLSRPSSPVFPLETPEEKEPGEERAAQVTRILTPLSEQEQLMQESLGCKMLLLEIIRRAAYDWVLYRDNKRVLNRMLADQAYDWLFVEGEGTPSRTVREAEGKEVTSFDAICDVLELNPDTLRGYIRKLTPKNILSTGRPAEYRHRDMSLGQVHDSGSFALPSHLASFGVDAGEGDDTLL